MQSIAVMGACLALAATGTAFAATGGESATRSEAHSYLSVSAFSRSGLVKQLKFEGFTTEQAKYGAAHVGANWSAQAAKAAKDYLRISGFSRSGLIHQLEFEGYTVGQATYGVKEAGL